MDSSVKIAIVRPGYEIAQSLANKTLLFF